MSNIIRLPGVPLTDPAWGEARRGQAPANAGRTFPPEVLTPDEAARLVSACSRRTPSGKRNRALLMVMWRSGLRVAEACALYPKDVDLESRIIRVLRGKGQKSRTVGIDPGGAAVVELWLAERRRLGIPASRPLFCTISADEERHGELYRALSTAYVRNLMKRLGARAGIEKRVHPHGLRHTFAYELAEEGVPVHVIQRALGHTSLAVTGRYLDHLSPSALVKALEGRSLPPGIDAAA